MQTCAVQVLHAAVHLALRVAEDAQLEDFGQELVGLSRGVALFGTHQNQQAGANLPDHRRIDADAGAAHPLDERQHAESGQGEAHELALANLHNVGACAELEAFVADDLAVHAHPAAVDQAVALAGAGRQASGFEQRANT